ncbi:MAG: hypothetical protein R3B91_06750 [Planctomycetaceae bacterium]
MPFFQSRDMFKPLWFILCAVSLVVGCGSDLLTNTLPIQVDNLNRVSPALLLSEVEKADDPKELLDADFQLENHSTLPQSLTRRKELLLLWRETGWCPSRTAHSVYNRTCFKPRSHV